MNAVIYCRVSSKEQVDGTSLESQEVACQEYAARNHLNVARTFIERGESAKYADRPQLLELLAFCAKRENAVGQLLVWKVDRLARNVGDHFSIKAGLMKQNIRVTSVTEPIDTNPEGKLLETILAGFAQFDNDIRAARCTQGMRRKIQEGLFPWKPPLGYMSANRPKAKKTQPDIPDQPAFSIIQGGLLEFATGSITKADLQRIFADRGLRTRRGKPLTHQSIDHLLCDEFYAGVIRDPWSGKEYQGRHLPMIDRSTFDAIQGIIAGGNRSVPHLAVRDDFPLRTFVRCGSCEATLTAAFSRGRSAKYPYYRCFRRECDNHTSYPLKEVHSEFTHFLGEMSTAPHIFAHLKEKIRVLGEARERECLVSRENSEIEVSRIKERLEQLVRLKVENLITDEEYKAHRARLYRRLVDLEGRADYSEEELKATLADMETLRPWLMNLPEFWQGMPTENRKRFQFITLPRGYVVGRIGTAEKGQLFSLIEDSLPAFANLVHPTSDSWHQLARELASLASMVGSVQSAA